MGFVSKIYTILLPSLTLTCVVTAHMMRQTRAAIINVLASAYIEMAEIKGKKRPRIIIIMRFRFLSPVINVIAVNMAYLVVGVVIVEVVFVYPGLGQLLVDSVAKRDLPWSRHRDWFFRLLIFFSIWLRISCPCFPIRNSDNPKFKRSYSSEILKKSPLSARIGMAIVLLNIMVAVFAPVIAPFGETKIVGDVWENASAQFYLGTDHIGRDLFTRMVFGARNTIALAFITTILSFLLAHSWGLLQRSRAAGPISC